MSADPKLIAPELVTAFQAIAPQFAQNFPGSSVQIIQGYRTPVLQNEAHLSGASSFNGRTSFSTHQYFPAEAMDLGVFENGVYITNGDDARYAWLGREFEREGFVWGGRFVHPKPDPDHVQMHVPNPTATQVADAFAEYQNETQDATAG